MFDRIRHILKTVANQVFGRDHEAYTLPDAKQPLDPQPSVPSSDGDTLPSAATESLATGSSRRRSSTGIKNIQSHDASAQPKQIPLSGGASSIKDFTSKEHRKEVQHPHETRANSVGPPKPASQVNTAPDTIQDSVDCTADSRPAVVHETVKPHVHTIYEPKRTRSIHVHEHRTVIQPVIDSEPVTGPAQHWVQDGNGDLPKLQSGHDNNKHAVNSGTVVKTSLA
ncbi:uncharacterized protein E0L32_000196 [Thyridium curvatum]|uniref:Uncharacterized protein n=1 Tax=Thyridium curvatum TaxID=1093900 RepID=A0A507B0S6_9PEZI|nr:uncharacterized protein E0L32_000196 [Thyridium curvatum]TPX15862.1 hypothetical protein E0L32_000196 [Thyridium curvatum]